MGLKRLLFAFLTMAGTLAAQQPQTQTAPDYAVNARYVQGVAPGYKPSKGSGLTLNIGPGRTRCGNPMVNYAGGTLMMADNTTNFVFVDAGASCAPSSNTTGYTATLGAIATVVTSAGVITSFIDDRTMGFEFKNGTAGLGTVTTLSAGNASGLFTTSVSNPTSTPALSFTLSNFAAHNVWGNNTGSSAAGSQVRLACADLSDSGSGCSGSVGASGTAGGDLTGTYPNPTVGKINGTSLAGLGTGILKNTTGTGVPSIAVAAVFPTLNQSTTGNAATATQLAATPSLCSTGQSPTGILANGNATGCTAQPYELVWNYAGKPAATTTYLWKSFTIPVSFPANFTTSTGKVLTNATSTTVFTVKKNGTTVGTISVASSGTITFATSGGTSVSVVSGDYFTLVTPAQDATLADVSLTLYGTR